MPRLNPDGEHPTGLHEILLRAVPANAHGRKTILHLSKLMGVSKQVVWHWIKKDFLTPERAKQVVDLSEGRVSLDELHRFVYRD